MVSVSPTIETALRSAAERLNPVTDSPRLDAEVILCHVLNKGRTYLRAWPEQVLAEAENEHFSRLLERRTQGHPVAYLTGMREFWSRDFLVTPDVLIPRPETELLVELILQRFSPAKSCRLIDLGTGSGILAITLALELPLAQISAADISPDALMVARKNALNLRVERICFYESYWFSNVPTGLFDIVVSNPPYLGVNDPHLRQGDLRFEPSTALVAEEHGLADIRVIAAQAYDRLETGGILLIEHGCQQDALVREIFADNRYQDVQTFKDLSGLPRVTTGKKPA